MIQKHATGHFGILDNAKLEKLANFSKTAPWAPLRRFAPATLQSTPPFGRNAAIELPADLKRPDV